jgi:hypothetical protein
MRYRSQPRITISLEKIEGVNLIPRKSCSTTYESTFITVSIPQALTKDHYGKLGGNFDIQK